MVDAQCESALIAESIIRRLDPSRIVYHHSSGNLGAMHTSNFYPNFVPVQEMSDWFEHWATQGVKPLFTCEYMVPMSWDWTMYRGWYNGRREFGSARAPWEFCIAEWNAQFLGDVAYQISQEERENLRWEARQFNAQRVWNRWDYPHQVGSSDFSERYPIYAKYFSENWPAFRIWGVSANSPWSHGHYWTLRDGVDTSRQDLAVDWQHLQRPGFSPDYIDQRYERIDLAYELSDWVPTVAATQLLRYNQPLLACLAGPAAAVTSQAHNYLAGELVQKQLVAINNSRVTVSAELQWNLDLPQPIRGNRAVAIEAGEQVRAELDFQLPDNTPPGAYRLQAKATFSTGEVQDDELTIHVVPPPAGLPRTGRIALFDPVGETRAWLDSVGVSYTVIGADADLAAYDLLIVGAKALTPFDPAPNIARVRQGLKVLLFEQTPEVLEQRFGFRVATYGLRQVFPRLAVHPVLSSLDPAFLSDWRGAATLVPPRLDYTLDEAFNYVPTVRWCGLAVPRLWRCGNRGNVATVLIEKPHRGDFLSILDGGFSLQYSGLLECREGDGVLLFCQLDVTGRTEPEPVAEQLARNMVTYLQSWQPPARRTVLWAGGASGRQHLESIGLSPEPYAADRLDSTTLLVVAAGGQRQLAGDKERIAKWLESGGQIVTIGLDGRAASSFLPMQIETNEGEHIAAYFPPLPVGSPLAGISPADVHSAAPRSIPLVTGPTAVGDGVLAVAPAGNIVLCQLAPFDLIGQLDQHNVKRTYRRNSYLLTRLLANLGAAGPTPIVDRFLQGVPSPVSPSVVRNGQFFEPGGDDDAAADWDFSGPEQATCRREPFGDDDKQRALAISSPASASSRSSAMLAQYDVPVQQNQWYRISLLARADEPAAKSVAITITDTKSWRSLFEYQRFDPTEQWQPYTFDVQAKETAARDTRLQIWFSGPGTLALANLQVQPLANPTQGRWLEGLYLDTPETWDDPYRFFRW